VLAQPGGIEQHLVEDRWRAVFRTLRRAIVAGELTAGDRLVEQELAQRVGTSRGPVRTALHELERIGLVVSVGRRGRVVRAPQPTDVEEIFSLTSLLTELAMRWAVTRLSSDDRRWLAALKRRASGPLTPEELAAHGRALGWYLVRVAEHRRVLDLYDATLAQASAHPVLGAPAGPVADWPARPGADLGALCDALAARDLDRAIARSRAAVATVEACWRVAPA
jgi:DNA-binding GntR family transcriptional regulator